jgi:hypothetical protein
MGLAMHNCNDTHGRLPPVAGNFGGAYLGPLMFHLLPFIEQQNVWNAAKFSGFIVPVWDTPGQGTTYLRQTLIKTYRCPSDPTLRMNVATDWFDGDISYAGNWQVFGNSQFNNTTMVIADWDGKGGIPKTFTDGTSNTVMFAEKLAYCPGTLRNAGLFFAGINGSHPHGGTWWMRGIYHSGSILAGVPSAGSQDSFPGDRLSAVFGGGYSSLDGTRWYTGVNSKFLVQPAHATLQAGPCDRGVASGFHTGGLVVGLGDGSVRILNQNMSAATWWSALTPNGGEVLGSDW